MKYPTLLFLVILLYSMCSSFYSQDIREIANLSKDNFKVYFYKVIDNDEASYKKLFVYFGNESNEYFSVYDHNGKEIYGKQIGKHITKYLNYFQFHEHIYILEKKLYSINLATFEFDSAEYDYNFNDYSLMQISESNSDTVLIAGTSSLVDIYKFGSFKKIGSFKREGTFKYAQSSELVEKIIVVKNKINELAAYNVDTKKRIWSLNTGKNSATFLGISIGSFEDRIRNLVPYTHKDKSLVFISTVFGHLYKLDLLSGDILLEKESFKGTGNNEGLLTSLYIVDMDKDGIEDLIGAAVDENIYCINGKDFSIIWEYDTGNEHQMPLALYDITGDDIPDVFGVNDYDNILSVIDGKTGELITDFSVKESDKFFQTYPKVADFNEKGFVNLMVRTSSSNLKIYKIKLP